MTTEVIANERAGRRKAKQKEYYETHKEEIAAKRKANGYKSQYKYIKNNQDYYNQKTNEYHKKSRARKKVGD